MELDEAYAGERGWDRLAEWYINHVRDGSENHRIARQVVVDLAGDVGGLRILDVGCGEGHVARALAGSGADVTGVDASANLIEAAKAADRAKGRGPVYVKDDARALTKVGDDFDGVVACLSLNDVDDLDASVVAISRTTAAKAWAVVVIPHPCFEAPNAQWSNDADGPGRVIPDGYLVERFWTSGRPGTVRGEVGNYHRPLSTYLNTFNNHGWVCVRSIEPHPRDEVPPQTPNFIGLRFDRR